MRHIIERALTLNVAAIAVRGSNHCGAMFYYALKAAEAGMIGIATTNGLPTMAPWGGIDKIVGTGAEPGINEKRSSSTPRPS